MFGKKFKATVEAFIKLQKRHNNAVYGAIHTNQARINVLDLRIKELEKILKKC